VAHLIRRYAANGDVDNERGRMALADLADFPVCGDIRTILFCPASWDLRTIDGL